jgi:ribokinase
MDLVVRMERWPGPGETLFGSDFSQVPGGKGANQAAAAAALGGAVGMVGRVGRDVFADALRRSLAAFGVDVTAIWSDPDRSTGIALIGVDASGENRIVVVSGANARLSPEDVERSLREGAWEDARVLLLQCEVPAHTVLAAARLGRERHMTVVLDPAPPVELPAEIWGAVDICTPNQSEATSLTGAPVTDASRAMQAGRELRSRGPRAVVIKLGAEGVVAVDEAGSRHIPGIPVRAVDTTAAGDVFNGALAVALAEGAPLAAAAGFANRAAAVSTTRPGAQTSLPRREEVEGR